MWDNNELTLITKCAAGTMQRTTGTSVTIGEDSSIIGGYGDGFIRAFQIVQGKKYSPSKWEIVNAHKGSVSSIYCVFFCFN